MMQTRYMPNTDATVSLLGFGAMRLPTDGEGNIDYFFRLYFMHMSSKEIVASSMFEVISSILDRI